MQRDPRHFMGGAPPTYAFEVGGYTHLGDHGTYGTYAAPPFGPAISGRRNDFPGPLGNEFEFQPMEACPKNFIIFDQSDNKSRVMFHPALTHKFSYPNFESHHPYVHGTGKNMDNCNDNQYLAKNSSTLKEDTAEIDALLCSEEDEGEEEEQDDDVVSTGRTPGNWRGSPQYSSSSTESPKSRKAKTSASVQNSVSSGGSSERKKDKMREMVKALRRIIPGGDQLDTPAVLDEAVRYLKSLKVEVKKLGIQNLEE